MKKHIKNSREDVNKKKLKHIFSLAKKYSETNPTESIELAEKVLIMANDLHENEIKISALLLLSGINYDKGKYSQAYLFCQEAHTLSKQIKNQEKITECLISFGAIKMEEGEYKESIRLLNESKKLCIQHNYESLLATSFHALALNYAHLGEYKKALSLNKKAYKLYDKLNIKSKKADTLNTLGTIYTALGDKTNSMLCAMDALALYKETNSKLGLSIIYGHIASRLITEGEYKEAEDYAKQGYELSIQLKNESNQAVCLMHLSLIETEKGNYSKALELLFKVLEIKEKFNEKDEICVALIRIGNIYREIEEYDLSLLHLQKAHKIAESLKELQHVAIALSSIGHTYKKKGNFNKAEDAFSKALIFNNEMGKSINRALNILDIGEILLLKGAHLQAIKRLFVAKKILESLDDKKGLAKCLSGLGLAYKEMKDNVNAIKYLKESLLLLEQIGNNVMIESIYNDLTEIYEHEGNYEEAYYVQRKYWAITKQMFNDQKAHSIARLQVEFDIKQKEKELKLQKLELKNTQLELQRKKEIEKLNKELEKKVEERTLALRHSNEQLKQYAYVVAHDLKEPLRSIHYFSSLIEDELKKSKKKEVKEYLGYLQRDTKRMHELLNDLLKLVKLRRSGQEEEELRTDLNETIKEVLELLKATIIEQEVEIVVGNLPEVGMANTHCIQLFQNLIQNGIKYKRQGVRCKIKVSSMRKEGGHILVVEDNGRGIRSKDKQKVFQLFARSTSAGGDTEGLGVGLSICKNIVEMYKGDIWIESEEGKGTRVYVKAPSANHKKQPDNSK